MSDILNLKQMDADEQDELREDITDAIWSVNSRLIIVIFLAVFGAIQLSLLSKAGVSEEMATAVNLSYSILGPLMGFYVSLPFIRYGLKYNSERVGKVLLGAVIIILAYSVVRGFL